MALRTQRLGAAAITTAISQNLFVVPTGYRALAKDGTIYNQDNIVHTVGLYLENAAATVASWLVGPTVLNARSTLNLPFQRFIVGEPGDVFFLFLGEATVAFPVHGALYGAKLLIT